jgi:hypothetical protein
LCGRFLIGKRGWERGRIGEAIQCLYSKIEESTTCLGFEYNPDSEESEGGIRGQLKSFTPESKIVEPKVKTLKTRIIATGSIY